MAVQFKTGGPRFQFQQVYQWIPQFGVHYAVGVDGIALVLILMSVVLMPVVVLASWNDVEASPRRDWSRRRPTSETGPVKPRVRARSVKSYFAHDAGTGDDDDRRLRGHRRLPVLRVLRGHADADVLHDRQLRRRPAAVRGGQVPAVQPARRPAHAGRGHRAVRLLHPRRAPGHVPVHAADPPGAQPDRRRSGCSSASSSRSRSRRRCGRSTPGCRTRRPRLSPAPRCCWSACWTRSARSA